MNKTLSLLSISLALCGCAATSNDNVKPLGLRVDIESTGPQIDSPYKRVNRLTQPLTKSIVDAHTTSMLRHSPAGGEICAPNGECRQFVQESKFYVSAQGNDSATVRWEVFSGRRVDFLLNIGMSEHKETSEISPEVLSIPDSRATLETVIKVGETKYLQGPYGSEALIRLTRDFTTP